MHKVSIKPQWTISDASGHNLAPRLLELLADVQSHGSLSGSCKKTGASYRHAWSLIRQGEQQLGMALLNMERGKGSTLTPLAEKLVWAGHRISARLTPMLESLASELEGEIGRLLASNSEALRVHASHGFAVEKMIEKLALTGTHVERKYVGSVEAVASLHEGACEIAGFRPLHRRQAAPYRHCRDLDAAHGRRFSQADYGSCGRADRQAGSAEGNGHQGDQVPHQSDRALRDRRTAG
ncbi:MAG: LysR family transcriptional regulator [Betaproteobacteria bacterium]|nr:LysR family transcriptional regulator [Betaproteobacteria bacterium]